MAEVARGTGNSKKTFLRKMRISRSSFVAGRQFFFILCAYRVLVVRRKHWFENRKEPEVEFFENFRPHFNGWLPTPAAQKRYCRFSLNSAQGRRLSWGRTLGVPYPGVFPAWEIFDILNAKIRFSLFRKILFLGQLLNGLRYLNADSCALYRSPNCVDW